MATQTIPEFLGVNTQCFLGKNERKKERVSVCHPDAYPLCY